MKMRTLIIALLSILMLGIADDADAQRRGRYKPSNKYKARKQTNKKISHYKGGARGYGRFKPYYFIGANINAGNYFGDLAPVNKAASTDISFTRPGFGFHGGYKFHHSMAVRAALNWVRVSGDDFSTDPNSEADLPRYIRNLSFRNDIQEFQVGLQINLLPNYGGVQQRLPFNAYLFFGGAVFLHNPKGKVPEFDYQADPSGATPAPQAGEWVSLRDLGTEGQTLDGGTGVYSNVEFSIPVAIGATLRLPQSDFNVGLEFGFRYLFTDYIDDVSTNYPDLVELAAQGGDVARILSDRSAEATSFQGDTRVLGTVSPVGGTPYFTGGFIAGDPRGNPDDNDMFFVTQIKLTYLISSSPKRGAKFR